jgi:hypothetical protein
LRRSYPQGLIQLEGQDRFDRKYLAHRKYGDEFPAFQAVFRKVFGKVIYKTLRELACVGLHAILPLLKLLQRFGKNMLDSSGGGGV